MKSSDFAKLLLAFADAIGRSPGREALHQLAKVFADSSSATVGAALKKFAKAPAVTGTPSSEEAAGVLAPLKTIAAAMGKTAVARDIEALIGMLTARGDTAISSLAVAPTAAPKSRATKVRAAGAGAGSPESVDAYVAQLQAAVGDDNRFPAIFGALQTDGSLAGTDLIAIARRFAHASVKSRSEALRKILAWHQGFVTSNAKARATAGRSAA